MYGKSIIARARKTSKSESRDKSAVENGFSFLFVKSVLFNSEVINFALVRLIGRQSTRVTLPITFNTYSVERRPVGVMTVSSSWCFNVMYDRDQVLRLAYKSIYVVGNARAICSPPNCC